MKTEKLQDMGMFSKGLGIKKDEANSGDIPAIRYGEIYTNHHEVIRSFRSSVSPLVAQNSRKLRSGDILFACSGETKADIGKCVAFTGKQDAYAGGDIIIFSPNKDILDSTWLGYYLNAPEVRKQKSAQAQGDAVVHISMGAVAGLNVIFPPLAEQQKIAAVLSDIDALIETQEALIAKKKDVKAATMELLLTGKKRLPGFHGNWSDIKIDDIGSVIRGASPRPKGDPRYYGGSVPRLMVEDVTRDGKYVTPTIDSLTEAGAQLSRPCRKGTLTIVCSGTVGVASFLAVDACIHDGFLAVVNIKPKFEPNFIYQQLSFNRWRFDETATHGGIFTNLTTDGVREFQLKFPPTKSEQDQISSLLDDLDVELNRLIIDLNKTINTKSAVMHKLLTGEIRLP